MFPYIHPHTVIIFADIITLNNTQMNLIPPQTKTVIFDGGRKHWALCKYHRNSNRFFLKLCLRVIQENLPHSPIYSEFEFALQVRNIIYEWSRLIPLLVKSSFHYWIVYFITLKQVVNKYIK